MTVLSRSRSLLKGYFSSSENNDGRSASPTPNSSEKLSAPATPPLTPDEDGVAENERVVMREAHTLPDVREWPHRPLMVCLNSAASPSLAVPEHGQAPCPIGVPFRCSSDLFEGTVLIRIKDSNSDNPADDIKYFSGRNRLYQHTIQGRFKKEIPASNVMAGYEFSRPLQNLPHPVILKMCLGLARKLVPGLDLCVHSDQPYFRGSILGSSKIVRADKPGDEPDITCRDFAEDCSLFGGDFAKGDVSAFRRKRIFSDPSKCQGYKLDPEAVYTFEFYEYIAHLPSLSLPLGFASIDIQPTLAGQPLTWVGKMRDGSYLWSFQMWHERLLPSSEEDDGSNEKSKGILLEE